MEPLQARVLRAGLSPVKGTRHLSLPQLQLEPYGATGDRRLCLLDITARAVLRTVQHPALVTVHAELRDGVLTVSLPDGRTATAAMEAAIEAAGGERLVCDYWGRPAELDVLAGPDAGRIAALFAERLGKPVALALAQPRAVIFAAGLTLVTQASLADLAARAGQTIDPARFRATFVLDAGHTGEPNAEPYAEDGWSGSELRLGEAVVRVGGPIGRCAVIDVDPVTGARDGRLLRALAAYRPRLSTGEPAFGVYAEVVQPGVVPVTPR